jgi:uncharacterized protein
MLELYNHYGIALLGGATLGLSVSLIMRFYGRITGISSILWDAVQNSRIFFPSNGMFLIGIISGAVIVTLTLGIHYKPTHSNIWVIIPAGLLVGYGSRLGSGCTSGHGICGISRLSARSLLATCSFMASGILTVFVMKHIL